MRVDGCMLVINCKQALFSGHRAVCSSRILVAAAVALPDDLVTGLLVLSLLSAPFSFEMAAPLLALPATNNERRSVMRRLVNLGLLSYNASLQMYTMHTLVRQAARLLVHNLGECSCYEQVFLATNCRGDLGFHECQSLYVLQGLSCNVWVYVQLHISIKVLISSAVPASYATVFGLMMCAGLPYVETRRRFAELLVSSARHLVLPLIGKNKMLSARLAWSRISVHVVQLLNWAFQEVREDMVQMYVALAWELMPLLSSSCGSHTLQGELGRW